VAQISHFIFSYKQIFQDSDLSATFVLHISGCLKLFVIFGRGSIKKSLFSEQNKGEMKAWI